MNNPDNFKPADAPSRGRKLATRFEELSIWQEARRLTKEVYFHFKTCRDFSFRDQVQRAALSVMNNIAEGFEKATRKDFARFLDQAKGSAGEVRSMTYMTEDLSYLPPEQTLALRAAYEQLSKSIASLIRHLRS
jgi:four helix bundle protein